MRITDQHAIGQPVDPAPTHLRCQSGFDPPENTIRPGTEMLADTILPPPPVVSVPRIPIVSVQRMKAVALINSCHSNDFALSAISGQGDKNLDPKERRATNLPL